MKMGHYSLPYREKSIIREYYKQRYVNKLGNLDEMEKFLERHKQLKLVQEEAENLNSPTASKETELIILKFPTKESPGPDDFTGEFHQRFKELTSILQKLSLKTEEKRTLPVFILLKTKQKRCL